MPPTRSTDRLKNLLILLGIIAGLTVLFSLLLAPFTPETVQEDGARVSVLSRILAFLSGPSCIFGVTLIIAYVTVFNILVLFVRQAYGLEEPEAKGFVQRIFYGAHVDPPRTPTLVIREGHANPDGPETMLNVGGPGHIAIGHDTAIITAKGGLLKAVRQAGVHRLDTFEYVWDVVDLRPQRREIVVEANTRDGIPVHCKAEVRFRIKSGLFPEEIEKLRATRGNLSKKELGELNKETLNDAILKVSTNKVALRTTGEKRLTDWTVRIAQAILDGEVRDRIEQYRLDELLNPETLRSPLLETLEREIQAEVMRLGRQSATVVERVELGPILPFEEDISKQWLELWRSKWKLQETKDSAAAKAIGTQTLKLARLEAEANLIVTVVESMKETSSEDFKMAPTLILLRFLDVVRALAEETDSLVRSSIFQQVESLSRIIKEIQEKTTDKAEGKFAFPPPPDTK
ncbi:MAG: hypothetical protein JXB35_00465 [Anaerolineae bacterium]|nr:hypothetical protein [Anaerolineae bacterium]